MVMLTTVSLTTMITMLRLQIKRGGLVFLAFHSRPNFPISLSAAIDTTSMMIETYMFFFFHLVVQTHI